MLLVSMLVSFAAAASGSFVSPKLFSLHCFARHSGPLVPTVRALSRVQLPIALGFLYSRDVLPHTWCESV